MKEDTQLPYSDTIPLTFSDDGRRFMVGLSWDHNENENYGEVKPYDLDLSCVIISKENEALDIITPMEPKRDKYKMMIFHSGDHMSGASDFEDESINVQINNIDDNISSLAFLVSSKSGERFSQIDNPECIFCDGTSLDQFLAINLAGADLSAAGTVHKKGYFLAGIISRAENDNEQWILKPMNHFLASKGLEELGTEIGELI